MKSIGAQQGRQMAFFDAQCRSNLPLEPRNRSKLASRPLNGVERLPDLLDQRAVHAQVDRALPIAVAEGEPIVGAEPFAVPRAIRCGDMSAACEDIGPCGDEPQSGMIELVSAFGNFQFQNLSSIFRRRKRRNSCTVDCSKCERRFPRQELGQEGEFLGGRSS